MLLSPYSTLSFWHIVGTQIFAQSMIMNELMEDTVKVMFGYSNSFIEQYPLTTYYVCRVLLGSGNTQVDLKELTVLRRRIKIYKSNEVRAENVITITYYGS